MNFPILFLVVAACGVVFALLSGWREERGWKRKAWVLSALIGAVSFVALLCSVSIR